MSAIFGIIDLKGRSIDPDWIRSMQTDLAHRGPDRQGIYEEESLVFGHQLLQITPESVYDKSPYIEDGLLITANARLDERKAIMDRLNIPEGERQIITDPLLLLRSYKKFGKDFVKDIYGDFSFAIWDKEKKELFCARDQMGVKPFLYYFHDSRLVFSTELKAIVKLPFVKTEIDHYLLRDKALAIYDEPDKTSWKNIFRLKGAHVFALKGENIEINQYWSPVYKWNPDFKTEKDSASALRQLLEKVIADHTRVIGEVGVPLSGGLDSSSVACLSARKLFLEGKKITTVSSIYKPGYSDAENPDEMEYINEVLHQEPNISPAFVHHSEIKFINDFERIFNAHYAPVNFFHYVDEAIYIQFHYKSIRRVLSGYLGDYTVSNSIINPFTILMMSGRFKTLFALIAKAQPKSGQSMPLFIRSKFLNYFAPEFIRKLWNIFKGRATNPNDIGIHPLILDQKTKSSLQQRLNDSYKFPSIGTKDISHNIWPQHWDFFEEDWDCGSSQHQIEMTYPLADRRILELLLQMPVEHFYSDGYKRGIIRKAMTGILPEKIRIRTDKGFYSPGYTGLFKKEISVINNFIENKRFYSNMDTLLDVEKLKIKLENLDKLNIINTFAYEVSSLVELVFWAYFTQWQSNNAKNN